MMEAASRHETTTDVMAMPWKAPILSPCQPGLVSLEALEQQARDQGHAQGYADGFAEGQTEGKRLIAQLEEILQALAHPLATVEEELEQALEQLAVAIATALVRQAYTFEPTLVESLVREAIKTVGSHDRNVKVHLNPDDLQAVHSLLSQEMHLRLAADPSLGRGDVKLHTDHMRLDATLATRLERMLKQIQNTTP